MSSSTFWAFTPYQTRLWIDAQAHRSEMDWDREIAAAWHIGAFGRIERLPALETLLRKSTPLAKRNPMTADEARGMLIRLNAAFGGIDRRAGH